MENVSQCSPACISKCQLIHVHGNKENWKSLVVVWLEQIPQSLKSVAKNIESLVTYYLEESLVCLSHQKSTYLRSPPARESIVRAFLRMYLGLLEEFVGYRSEVIDEKQQDPILDSRHVHQGIEGTLILSLIWTVGMYVLEHGR